MTAKTGFGSGRSTRFVCGGLLIGTLGLVGLAISACSTGGESQSVEDGEASLVDPCEPACCCRVKENYYVRFNCSGRAQCMSNGGTCTTDEVAKCRTGTQSDASLPLQRDAATRTFEAPPAETGG